MTGRRAARPWRTLARWRPWCKPPRTPRGRPASPACAVPAQVAFSLELAAQPLDDRPLLLADVRAVAPRIDTLGHAEREAALEIAELAVEVGPAGGHHHRHHVVAPVADLPCARRA